jgi:hypothetical protein
MWFRSLFHACLARSRPTPVSRSRRVQRVRPLLELLEDRTLLSTYTVNALTDTGAGSGLTGDLRYCVTKATSGSDTITFASGLTGTIALQSALPALNASVAIQGPGAAQLAVSGGFGKFTMFTVGSAAHVAISGLPLEKAEYYAINNSGSLVASNMSFTLNNDTGSDCAIYNQGSATVRNSIFSDNSYGIDCNQPPGVTNTLEVSNCTFSGNDSAIITIGSATVSDSSFSGNLEGAMANAGNLTVNSCTLSSGGSVALYNSQHATLTVNNSTISDNSGGGIQNVGSATINYSTITGNRGPYSSYGGGIVNTGNLTISNSTISGNKSIGSAAGYVTGGPSGSTVHVVAAGTGTGGGIYMGGGTLTISSSTIADNEAEGGSSAGLDVPGLAGNGYGGGLYIAGGTVTINNSTLAGNSASGGGGYHPGSGYGGGIDNAAGAGALQMYDTILANNTANAADGPDLNGSVTSHGHNLIGNTTGGSGFVASDLLNVNPQLGHLQNNGGPTQTIALSGGSPAINAGDNTNAPAYDQRGPGFPRIVGGTIDIGAFEVQLATHQFNDPGFETPNVGTGSFRDFAYNPSGAPWTYSSSSGVAGNKSGFTDRNPSAPQGTQVAFLQDYGSISQVVNFTAGTYAISFEAAQRAGQASSQTFEVQVDGMVVGTIKPTGTSYNLYSTNTFTVTAGTHTVKFVGLDPNGGDNTALLDEASI